MRLASLAFVVVLLAASAPALVRADPPPGSPSARSGPPAAVTTPETLVMVSVRIVKATPRAARSIRLLGTARTPDEAPTYDAAALERRLACWQRARQATVVSAPRVAALPGQKANVTIGENVSYVQDFELELATMATWVANPILGTVFDGLAVDCTGAPAHGGVSLTAALTLSEVKRPIEVFETTLAGATPKVQIQLPEVRIRKAERALVLAPGKAALLADWLPVPGEWEGRTLLAWIEARTIRDPGVAETGSKAAATAR